jgi:hypothetical protein
MITAVIAVGIKNLRARGIDGSSPTDGDGDGDGVRMVPSSAQDPALPFAQSQSR